MKKIIVPIDFSEYSENALKSAVNIAKDNDAAIIVVHMLELPDAYFTQSNSFSQEQIVFHMKLAEKRLAEFLDKPYLAEVDITSILKQNKIFSELNELARHEKADFIVMGSKGVSGLKEIFIGSNTEKVIRNSEVPVLVIKDEPITTDLKRAVYACDFVGGDDVEPFKRIKEILKSFSCDLELLYVNTPDNNFKTTKQQVEDVSKFLEEVDGNLSNFNDVSFVSDHTVEAGVFEFANENNIDLLILSTHGRKGLSHFFNGSISEEITNHSKLPVMTIKI